MLIQLNQVQGLWEWEYNKKYEAFILLDSNTKTG